MIDAGARALFESPLGLVMRETSWAYPLANIAHLFGLALLAGGILAVDLRLMGAFRRIPLAPLSAALTPFAITGLVLFAASGLALCATEATTLIGQPVFIAKMAVIALATGLALGFRWRWHNELRLWTGRVPLAPRVLAAMSLSLWSSAIILGRMIAYR
jgi:uncharacterized membrane protein